MEFSHDPVGALVLDVEALCAEIGISATEFGLRAVNDGRIIHDLRAQRRSPRVNTLQKLRRAIDVERKKAAATAAETAA